MKKLLTIAALASTVAAYAVSIEVGTVGVTKISTTAKNTIVATSYNELDGSGAGSMAVSNIVKTANLPAGTKLYALSGANAYEGYTLTAVGGVKQWVRDLNYTVASNGALSGGTASTSTSVPSLSVGKGFWISLPDAESYSADIIVYGKPPATTNMTMTANSVVLVGNPTQSNKAPTITGMAKGDKIMVFEGGATTPTIYRSNGSAWQKVGVAETGTAASIITAIPAGTGFWYVSKGTALIDWTK